MGEFWAVYLGGLAVLVGCMGVLWVVSVLLRDASIVDIFWGMMFVISGWYYFGQAAGGDPARRMLAVEKPGYEEYVKRTSVFFPLPRRE